MSAKMTRLFPSCLLLFVLLCTGTAFSQRIEDFEYLNDPIDNELFLGIGLNRSHVANPVAPYPENHELAAWLFYFDLKKVRTEKGKSSLWFSNQLLGDMVLLLQQTLKNPNSIYRSESSSLSSGLLGWWSWGWNLTRPGRFQPFAGVNHNDYFFSATYVPDSTNPGERITQEPQGYYFAAGPMAGARLATGKFGILEAKSTYSFSYWRAVSVTYAEEDKSYPKPHWFHAQLDYQTKWGVFANLHHYRIINRGDLPNATRRWDATLGFRFMF